MGALLVGKSLGPYEIIESLGAGGMGEVYVAEDTRLGRKVAVKVLPPEFAGDPERLARFEQEARAAAALNHPHIAAVFDVGSELVEVHEGSDPTEVTTAGGAAVHFIVQEYLEGETLREPLKKGALPLKKALDLAIEIAEALSAAHSAGIIHRDLKPENVFVTEEGHTKILDFGLAKLTELLRVTTGGSDEAESPTALGTMAGHVMGTAGYMAPEQVEGQAVDHRVDLFAFGCVLYEMATGARSFAGRSTVETLQQIVHEEPSPLIEVDDQLPVQLQWVLNKCMAKAPAERYQQAADLAVDLRGVHREVDSGVALTLGGVQAARAAQAAGGVSGLDVAAVAAGAPAGPGSKLRSALPWAVAGAAVAVAVVAVAWSLSRSTETSTLMPTRFSIDIGATDLFSATPPFAISPDGSRLVYVRVAGGTQQLYVREIDELVAAPMPGTEGANSPFFSPDGRWVGFFAEGEMRKVAVSGGPPLRICAVPTVFAGADWGPDDTIVFSTWATSTGLFRVAASGGVAEPATTLADGEVSHEWPHWLPDGETVLAAVNDRGSSWFKAISLRTGESQALFQGQGGVRYLPSGHLAYTVSGRLMAVPFDPQSFELDHTPVAVVDDLYVPPERVFGGYFSISDTGSLLYLEGSGETGLSLVWVERDGSVTSLPLAAGLYSRPSLSPDDRRVTFSIASETDDAYVYDLRRGGLTRVTFDGGTVSIWGADGERIVYSGRSLGTADLYWKPADGTGEAEALVVSRAGKWPTDVSPEGRFLAFYELNPETSRDIWILPLDGSGEPYPFLVTPASERSAVFSPDGRWIAYASDASGRDEVYVRQFPGGEGGEILISTEGGREPRWSPDGAELFFRHGDQMIAVDVETGPEFTPGPPRVLFEGQYAVEIGGRNQEYDVSLDGQRFLMLKPETTGGELTAVVNWVEELKRLVPVER